MERKVYEFISAKTNDPIVEWKTCTISGKPFAIFQSDLNFYDKISPVFNGIKYGIPTPTLCPEERHRRRLMFRNERKLYRRKCDASGKQIISIYSPDKSFKVYQQSFWWGDQRDALEYGFDFDFTQSFTHQFARLQRSVPKLSISNVNTVNSEYVNFTEGTKDSYLSSVVFYDSERIFYSHQIYNGKVVIDCSYCDNLEECFELTDSSHCYLCFNSSYLSNCQSCYFSYALEGCSNCIECSNLVNKHYCIKNIQYTKEEYENYFAGALKMTQMMCFEEIRNSCIQKQCIHSFGSNIFNAKHSILCFDSHNIESCKYCQTGIEEGKDVFDSRGGILELTYEATNTGFGSCFICTNGVSHGSNVLYSDQCYRCNYIFGCVGLRDKNYCILNKQYSKEEYEQLVPKIIEHMIQNGEWGEFFSPELSPFGYNETVAYEEYPITKDIALSRKYKWQDVIYDTKTPDSSQVLRRDQIPRFSSSANNSILEKILICEISGRPFRLIKVELDFYQKHHLPIPRKHPDIRHLERMKLRTQRTLHLRNCNKCDNEIVSVYPPEYQGKVYCESCYNKEIFG